MMPIIKNPTIRLRASHDALLTSHAELLAAAKALVERSTHETYSALRAAIAKAEELTEYVWLEKEHREEIMALTNELDRLRASRDALFAALKDAVGFIEENHKFSGVADYKAAIAVAEEPSDETAARDFMAKHPHATSPSEE